MLVKEAVWCASLTLVSVFAYWSINYIAAEIEMPFGEDDNDLPISLLQEGFNTSLRMLLDECTRKPPAYDFNPNVARELETFKCPYQLITSSQHSTWRSDHYLIRKAE